MFLSNNIFIAAFEWSHIIENTNEVYAILFVAHSNGSVSSWKYTRIVENTLEPSPLQFVGKFESQVSNVSVMYWRSYGGNGRYFPYIISLLVITMFCRYSIKFSHIFDKKYVIPRG